MPNPLEIEKQLLSAMVMNNKIIPDVMKKFSPESFTDDTHQAIFNSIVILFAQRHAVGVGLVLAHLAKQDIDIDLGYVAEVLNYFKTHKDYNRHVALLSKLETP